MPGDRGGRQAIFFRSGVHRYGGVWLPLFSRFDIGSKDRFRVARRVTIQVFWRKFALHFGLLMSPFRAVFSLLAVQELARTGTSRPYFWTIGSDFPGALLTIYGPISPSTSGSF